MIDRVGEVWEVGPPGPTSIYLVVELDAGPVARWNSIVLYSEESSRADAGTWRAIPEYTLSGGHSFWRKLADPKSELATSSDA